MYGHFSFLYCWERFRTPSALFNDSMVEMNCAHAPKIVSAGASFSYIFLINKQTVLCPQYEFLHFVNKI